MMPFSNHFYKILLIFLFFISTSAPIKKIILEDDFSDKNLFDKHWKAKGNKHYKYGGRRKELRFKPRQSGHETFIEAEIPLYHHNSPPHLRIRLNLTIKGFCDNHYVVLRSESLTANIPGQHPGVAMYTAGMGHVGGTWANTGQIAFLGWECDEKVLHTAEDEKRTRCESYTNCPIDITLNKTEIIFKDMCGCKTLKVKKYIWPRRKVLYLILGAHTIIGSTTGAVWHNVKVYSLDHHTEDDEELEEIPYEDPSDIYRGYSLDDATTGKIDVELHNKLLSERRLSYNIRKEMIDEGDLEP